MKKEVIYPGEPRLDEGKRSLSEQTGGAWMFIADKQEPEGQNHLPVFIGLIPHILHPKHRKGDASFGGNPSCLAIHGPITE